VLHDGMTDQRAGYLPHTKKAKIPMHIHSLHVSGNNAVMFVIIFSSTIDIIHISVTVIILWQ